MKNILLAAAMLLTAASVRAEERKMEKKHETATLAGGCFWCMQPPFDGLKGVLKTTVGYTGGKSKNPTYEEVCRGDSGHLEAVEVVFDPALTTYSEILEAFWRSIDPTDPGGQFFDRGEQYATAVFYHDEEQRKAAEASKKALADSGRFGKPIAVRIRPAAPFYPAEEHHQKYYCKRPAHYDSYKKGSGREGFLERTWKGK
jgi:peptide methionine sulfoxide reductase msrA/msrB